MSERPSSTVPADPRISDLTLLHEADRQTVGELFAETASHTDTQASAEALQAFGMLAVELATNSLLQQQAEREIATARNYLRPAEAPKLSCKLDGTKIGWIPGDSGISVALEQMGDNERPYLFGNLVGGHRVTRDAFEHLEAEGEAKRLLGTLTGSVVPEFLENLRSRRGKLRPISIGNRIPKSVEASRSLNTSYPAYKLDVLGTNNRAIILLPEKVEGVPVIVLAALYDHEDQDRVGHALYLKWIPRKR